MSAVAAAHARHLSRRDFFWLLVRRDLKTRYAGSALGALWSLIHPVAMILVYIAIFSSLITDRSPGARPLDYAAHLCGGMLVWLAFSEALQRCATALTDNSNFLQKIWFPPTLLHASILFNVTLVYGAGFVALLALLAAMGRAVPLSALAALPVIALAAASATGLGLVLSGLHVFFRDTAQAIVVILQIGFWFNPIVYPKSMLEGSSVGNWSALLRLNPIENFVSMAQSFLGDPQAAPWPYAGWVVVLFPVGAIALGAALFRRMLPDIRDGL